MPKATYVGGGKSGSLVPLDPKKCYIKIGNGPNAPKILFNALPEISDKKEANYSDTPVLGRSSPMKTYGNSGVRAITMVLHFYVTHPEDVEGNMQYLRLIESLVYPRTESGNAPFIPPPVCRIRCGTLLASREDVCVVLRSYSVAFPTDVAWDQISYTPYKFDVTTSWDVIYTARDLPGQEQIFKSGV